MKTQTNKIPVVYQIWFIILSLFLTVWPLAIYLSFRRKKYLSEENISTPRSGFYILYVLGSILMLYAVSSRLNETININKYENYSISYQQTAPDDLERLESGFLTKDSLTNFLSTNDDFIKGKKEDRTIYRRKDNPSFFIYTTDDTEQDGYTIIYLSKNYLYSYSPSDNQSSFILVVNKGDGLENDNFLTIDFDSQEIIQDSELFDQNQKEEITRTIPIFKQYIESSKFN